MQDAERGGGVGFGGGLDPGDAVAVEGDVHRGGERGDAHLQSSRRQGQPHHGDHAGGGQEEQADQPGQEDADEAHCGGSCTGERGHARGRGAVCWTDPGPEEARLRLCLKLRQRQAFGIHSLREWLPKASGWRVRA